MFQKNALERGLLKQQKSLDLLANVYTSCPSAYLWISPLGLQGQHRALGKKAGTRKKELIALYMVC